MGWVSAPLLLGLVAGCASSTKAPAGAVNASSSDTQLYVNAGLCTEGKGSGLHLPVVRSVVPDEGTSLGGTTITVTGEGFAKGASVMIGESTCFDVTVTDDRTLTCLTGSHPSGRAEVVVINPDRRCGSLAKAFTYIPSVMISPRSKVVAVGNKIKFSASGGRQPYNFTLISGVGSLDADGNFQAPETPGSAVIRVTDSMSTQSDAVVTINPPLTIVPRETPGPSGFNFDVKGGAPPITYSIERGEGTESDPSKSSTVTVVKVVDSAGNTAEIGLNINRINPLVLYPLLLNVVPGDRVNFFASGGVPPYKYSVLSGMGSVNEKSGVYTAPTETGTDTVRVTDASETTVDASITITSDAFGLHRLALGYGHSCALAMGSVKCWGDNRFGQIGNGTMVDWKIPVPVLGLGKNVLSITSGYNHTCALANGGMAKCWGDNRFGQIGDGSDVNSTRPETVFGLHSGVQAVSAGQFHTCAIVRGAVYCWGSNRRGQLGNGTTQQSSIPVPVKGLGEGVVAIGSGAAHSCALTKDGAVKCWGYNYSGQLGDGTLTDRLTPVEVKGLTTGVQAVFVGGHHSCAMKNGGLQCWGNNGLGQLGINSTKNSLIPVDVEGMTGQLKYVAAGFYHTCAWVESGGAKCWGYNRDGQAGGETSEPHRDIPADVSGLTDIVGLAAGVNHSCALVPGGVRCWGSNASGQFGNRSVVGSVTPVPSEPLQ